MRVHHDMKIDIARDIDLFQKHIQEESHLQMCCISAKQLLINDILY